MFGLIGLLQVPVQLTPNVDQPVVSVTTRWFGAQPQEIEQEILQEQEEVLKTIPGLREMTSEAVEGQGTVRLEFYVGVDKTRRHQRGRAEAQPGARVPAGRRPAGHRVGRQQRARLDRVDARPPAQQRPGEPQGRRQPVPRRRRRARAVPPRLRQARARARPRACATCRCSAGAIREMQVRVDLAALAARGITIDAFVEALRDENLNVSAGAVAQGKRDVSVRAIGQYDDPRAAPRHRRRLDRRRRAGLRRATSPRSASASSGRCRSSARRGRT